MGTPDATPQVLDQKTIKDNNSKFEKILLLKQLREGPNGIRLILTYRNEDGNFDDNGRSIFGGHYAEEINKSLYFELFEKIKTAENFASLSSKTRNVIDVLLKKKLPRLLENINLKYITNKPGIIAEIPIAADKNGKINDDVCRLIRLHTDPNIKKILDKMGEPTNDFRLNLTKKNSSEREGLHFAGEYQNQIPPKEYENLMEQIYSVPNFMNLSEKTVII